MGWKAERINTPILFPGWHQQLFVCCLGILTCVEWCRFCIVFFYYQSNDWQ